VIELSAASFDFAERRELLVFGDYSYHGTGNIKSIGDNAIPLRRREVD
jgi:hypothetical protein